MMKLIGFLSPKHVMIGFEPDVRDALLFDQAKAHSVRNVRGHRTGTAWIRSTAVHQQAPTLY
jgi:hypothetical protein